MALELAYLKKNVKPEDIVLTHGGIIDYIKSRRVQREVLKTFGDIFNISPRGTLP
jgi:hypothetical protein